MLAHSLQFFVQSGQHGLGDPLLKSVERVGHREGVDSVGVEEILEAVTDSVSYQDCLSCDVLALEEQCDRLDDIRDRFARGLVCRD